MNQENFIPTYEKSSKEPNYLARKIGVTALALMLVAFAATEGVKLAKDGLAYELDHLKNPLQYSEKLDYYAAQPNDGLNNVAEQVDGVGSVPLGDVKNYVENIPVNKEVLSDGIQVGDVIAYPESVKKR